MPFQLCEYSTGEPGKHKEKLLPKESFSQITCNKSFICQMKTTKISTSSNLEAKRYRKIYFFYPIVMKKKR